MERTKREIMIAFTLDTLGTAVRRMETFPKQAMQNVDPIGYVTFLVGVDGDSNGQVVPLDSFEVPAEEATSGETVAKLKKMVKGVTKKTVAAAERQELYVEMRIEFE